MILTTSNYWNIIHGMLPGEVVKDDEGKQIMEVLAGNMSWLLKMKEQAKDSVPTPSRVEKIRTNFIR